MPGINVRLDLKQSLLAYLRMHAYDTIDVSLENIETPIMNTQSSPEGISITYLLGLFVNSIFLCSH